jgi:hypothetical protein
MDEKLPKYTYNMLICTKNCSIMHENAQTYQNMHSSRLSYVSQRVTQHFPIPN